MSVRIEEDSPERLAQLARAWGVKVVAGQHPGVTTAAIEAAYRSEVDAEARKAMHQSAVRRMREVG